MTDEERISRAVELFRSGYNCSQAVVAAFADRYGIAPDQALLMSSSFGGGIGRMRLTCGAACGMFMLAGLETGTTDPKNREAKANNYALVQQLAEEFKQRNGALACGDLLGLARPGQPARKPKRPCAQIVEEAARIYAEALRKRQIEAEQATKSQ